MYEVIFLLVLAVIWISAASWQDLKKREVPNWLSFSLIVFALGFRFFWSLFEANNFNFFYQGLIGFGIFLILGNLFYYARMFAGGDAKLMIALGAVLPLSENFMINLKVFAMFFFIFLFVGMFYGLVWSFGLVFKNFNGVKNEMKKRFFYNRKIIYPVMIGALVLMLLGFVDTIFLIFGVFLFLFPYVFIYAKAVDEAGMIKKIKVSELTEGDWLYKDVKIGDETIKAHWEGLSKKDIELLKKNGKSVLIRHGIPFVPVFLISFLILIYVWFSGILPVATS